MEENMNVNQMENQVEETKKGSGLLKAGLIAAAAVGAAVCATVAFCKKKAKSKAAAQEESCAEEPIECECEEVEEASDEE